MLSTLVLRPRTALAATILAAIGTTSAGAQHPVAVPRVELASAGGEWERYARALQLVGAVAAHPWSIRAFGPAEAARLAPTDTLHPWARRPRPARRSSPGVRRPVLGLVAPEARVVYNTSYPFGYNDGAVWAGRGATLAASAGGVAAWGPLTVTLAPTYFIAQNRPFALRPNGLGGSGRFQDGFWPTSIDQPQRFGDARYARLDWGQSGARLDAAGVSVGLTTANEAWGPAAEHPIILGTNAPGFAHAFAGTTLPLDVGVGRVHGRLLWGRLEQSAYSPSDSLRRRFASGAVATFSPRGAPGLEIGAARFFHSPWPRGGIGSALLLKPFEGILKSSLASRSNPSGDEPLDNQIASIFARWAFPRAALEVYAEYGREDHNQDGRDLALQPDHDAAYVLGLQRAWRSAGRIVVGRAEVLNSRQTHLGQVRRQAPFYIHSPLTQGHTHRGQVLGSAGAFGGGAGSLAADVYLPGGRWTVRWSRVMRAEYEQRDEGRLPDPERADVLHAVGVDAVLFRARHELVGGVTAVQNFNRDFGADAFSANLAIGVRAHW